MSRKAAAREPLSLTIKNLQVLGGPNIWSDSPVITCQLVRESPRKISLRSHAALCRRLHDQFRRFGSDPCSPTEAQTLSECFACGAPLHQLVEHIARALQTLTGQSERLGRPHARDGRRSTIILGYEEEEVGRASLQMALTMVEEAWAGQALDIDGAAARLNELFRGVCLDPVSAAIAREARARGIPTRRIRAPSTLQLGSGQYLRRISGVISDLSSAVAVALARDIPASRRILAGAGLPVPRGIPAKDAQQAIGAAQSIGYPIALTGPRMAAICIGGVCKNDDELSRMWSLASAEAAKEDIDASPVEISKHVDGSDFYALVVDGEIYAVVHRAVPARQPEPQPLSDTNAWVQPRPGLMRVPADSRRSNDLPRLDFSVNRPVDVSSRETHVDRTSDVHPINRAACSIATRMLGLTVAVVHMRSPDISAPLRENGGAIIDVDATANLAHFEGVCDEAVARVARFVVDRLFPPEAPTAVPILAVTGTNGKTTTTRLVAHVLGSCYRNIGTKTTDYTSVGDRIIYRGDFITADAAAILAANTDVDVMVLETPHGAILWHGLGYQESDVGIVLNVASDHLGPENLETIHQLATVKRIVVSRVREGGHAILNADDPLVLSMREHTKGQVVLISELPRAQSHALRTHAGPIVCLENGIYVVYERGSRSHVAHVADVPLTMGGSARFQHQNVLAAIAAAYSCGIDLGTIRSRLSSFFPVPTVNPGRINLLRVGALSVLVDYAHNAHALSGLMDFVSALPANRRIAVVGVPADRRDDDIRECGRVVAAFDYLILRERDRPGPRPAGEVAALLAAGLRESAKDPAEFEILLSEFAAVERAMSLASDGDLVVLLVNDVNGVIAQICEYARRQSGKGVAGGRRRPTDPPRVHPMR